MKHNQHTGDWDKRFSKEDTPWEDASPWGGLSGVLERYIKPGSTVLDVGCGLGVNTIEIARLGYTATGVDISARAVESAIKSAGRQCVNCRFEVLDFLNHNYSRKFDCIFDRGCFHSFRDQSGRAAFSRKVAGSLKASGIWIDVSGSRDNPDDPKEVEKYGYPRVSAAEIVSAVEPLFEIMELSSCIYGNTPGRTDFRAWLGVFRKRSAVV